MTSRPIQARPVRRRGTQRPDRSLCRPARRRRPGRPTASPIGSPSGWSGPVALAANAPGDLAALLDDALQAGVAGMPLAPADDLPTVESAAVDAATGQSQHEPPSSPGGSPATLVGPPPSTPASPPPSTPASPPASTPVGPPCRRHRWVRRRVCRVVRRRRRRWVRRRVCRVVRRRVCRWVCRRLWPRVVRRRRFLVLRQWSRLDRRRHPQPARRRPCPVTHLACRQACRSWCRGHRRRPAPERSAPHPSVEVREFRPSTLGWWRTAMRCSRPEHHGSTNYVLVVPLVWLAWAIDRDDGGLRYLRFANLAFASVGLVFTYLLDRRGERVAPCRARRGEPPRRAAPWPLRVRRGTQ